MFSKIRNRIKSKPLKINLKMHSKTDEQGLEAGGTGIYYDLNNKSIWMVKHVFLNKYKTTIQQFKG